LASSEEVKKLTKLLTAGKRVRQGYKLLIIKRVDQLSCDWGKGCSSKGYEKRQEFGDCLGGTDGVFT